MCNAIKSLSNWVLVLDNADNLTLFNGAGQSEYASNLRYFVPSSATGAVLWTSRDKQIVGTLVGPRRGIEVEPMNPSEAAKLLVIIAHDGVSDGGIDSDALLEELQWHPLAISQAGAYMRMMLMPADEYLSLLQQGKHRWDVLADSHIDRHRRPDVPNSVLETWRISIERIQAEGPIAYTLLHTMGYLENHNIPYEAVVESVVCMGLGDGNALNTKAAISRLVHFSFVGVRRATNGEQIYEMHKLVQEAVQYRLSVGERSEGAEWIEKNEAYFSSTAFEVISKLFPASERATRMQCEKYLIHAVHVGQWAELCGREVEVSALLGRVSKFLDDRGQWREKQPVDERALGLRRKILGEKHPHTVESMAHLAATYNKQGRYEEAEGIKDEVLKPLKI